MLRIEYCDMLLMPVNVWNKRGMSESKNNNSQFWQIFVTLLILFGIISIMSQNFTWDWYYTWGAVTVTTVVVVFIFRKFNR